MAHHDGWVSTQNWEIKRLERVLSIKSTKLLNDYNGLDGGFSIKLKKVKLGEVMMGDWKDKVYTCLNDAVLTKKEDVNKKTITKLKNPPNRTILSWSYYSWKM